MSKRKIETVIIGSHKAAEALSKRLEARRRAERLAEIDRKLDALLIKRDTKHS